MSKLKSFAKGALEEISNLHPHNWEILRISLQGLRTVESAGHDHLHQAIEWIKRAQDVSGCGGVSWGYRVKAPIRTQAKTGWQPPYPETSGYILETLLRHGHMYQDNDSIQRARKIADWETSIQLEDGGIQGGTIGSSPVESSTFVTGQVLFGFVRAFQEFGEERYARAANRAAGFLMSCLGEDGAFNKGFSRFCATGPKVYEVRTGWALVEHGLVLNDDRAVRFGRSTADFAIRNQLENGWFQLNDLDRHDEPLTHTIGYTLEALFEIGKILDHGPYLDAVHRTLQTIKQLVRPDGFLAGRWTREWKPAATWSCLTGSCQIAAVCCRMHKLYPDAEFDALATKLLSFVAGTQVTGSEDPGVNGGIHGSYPFNGEYGRYCNLNWAAKFFADAVMDLMEIQRSGVRA